MRQRYLLTRDNRLRLRYVTGSMASCMVLVAVLFAASDTVSVGGGHAPGHSLVAATHTPAEFYAAADTGFGAVLQSQISEGIRKASIAIKKAPAVQNRQIEVGKGDTIAGVLQEAGMNGEEAFRVVEALREHYDPRRIVAGQMIDVSYRSDAGQPDFANLRIRLDAAREVTVSKKGAGEYVSELREKELVNRTYARAAKIETSLYGSAAKAGIPQRVISEVIRVYSWNIDFQRDIRQGDTIEILYDVQETEDGEFVRNGDVQYARLVIGGKDVPIYRFELADGRVDYFQEDGRSIRKALMKTPIDGARISSGFGMRRHPILGYNKMHKGMDFAAPTGTPIYAAGDGVVEAAERQSGYGNYVRVRHNNTIKTAYAHMHRFAKGISKGTRVKQGEVIGYVGSTGRSTGPHLHYEVLVNGVQKNPNSVDLPTGEQLASKDMDRFRGIVKALKQQYAALSDGLKFASRETGVRNPVR